MRFAQLFLAAALFCFGILPALASDPQSEARAAIDAGDYAKAAKLLQALADKGDGAAAFNLGVMYGRGQGVAKSDVIAASWFEKAARDGNALAQLDLGIMYRNGQGVAIDFPHSYMWLDVAASNLTGADGAQAMKFRDDVAKRMTPQQLQDAQDMSDNCKLAGVKSCD
ncbi:MAG: tetratricopeptide repeat protein [Parvibaculum sp.]|jgi:TPR repeat protein|uniref:tetratricopeptide repeat protein n=1 Tax=Parvibaculum sp. TaxID=2024848 RepID=UPI002845663C|nr:tetratricopeptide repeat protein [Parvibaculum sp.]MDR3498102.1 tetratricopeptide repeat protein [Parvibaculum sp.]